MDYWRECIECSVDERGIALTDEQIGWLAEDVAGAHENYGMAYPTPSGPSQIEKDYAELEEKLRDEKDKVHCNACGGRGRIYSQGPYHGSDTECWKCRGEGRHAPGR